MFKKIAKHPKYIVFVLATISVFLSGIYINFFKVYHKAIPLKSHPNEKIQEWYQDLKNFKHNGVSLNNNNLDKVVLITPDEMPRDKIDKFIKKMNVLSRSDNFRTEGQCFTTLLFKNLIIIREINKNLLMHELGHCAFYLSHEKSYTSIMHSDIIMDDFEYPIILEEIFYRSPNYLHFYSFMLFELLGNLLILIALVYFSKQVSRGEIYVKKK